ncbi:MAG TPA: lipopolysaccharide biosynthesis protein [Acidimicrobiales bacterium]|nr:lipopolysaccharide biosynthesis protein [Acidimicrobiales bacterium]
MTGTVGPDPSGMPRISRLGANTLALRTLSYALGAVGSVLIARALGPAGRGRYYLPVTVATVAYYLGSLGVERAQLRLWSRREADPEELVTSGAFLAAGLGALAVTVTWLVYALARSSLLPGVKGLELAIAVATVPLQIHALLVTGVLIAAAKLALVNRAALLAAVAQTAGLAALFAIGQLTVVSVLLLYGVSVTVPWIVMLCGLRAIGRIRLPVPWSLMGRQVRLGFQQTPYIVGNFLNLRIDIFLVARFAGVAGVGLYSVAVALVELVWLVTDSVVASVAERQANGEEAEAVDVTLRAMRMCLLLSVGTAALLGLVAPLMVPLVYGDRFGPAARVVWSLVPAVATMALWRAAAPLVTRFAHPGFQSAVATAAVVLNVAANVVLLPELGLVGAGVASSLSYGLGAVVVGAWLVARYSIPLADFLPGPAEVRQLREVRIR